MTTLTRWLDAPDGALIRSACGMWCVVHKSLLAVVKPTGGDEGRFYDPDPESPSRCIVTLSQAENYAHQTNPGAWGLPATIISRRAPGSSPLRNVAWTVENLRLCEQGWLEQTHPDVGSCVAWKDAPDNVILRPTTSAAVIAKYTTRATYLIGHNGVKQAGPTHGGYWPWSDCEIYGYNLDTPVLIVTYIDPHDTDMERVRRAADVALASELIHDRWAAHQASPLQSVTVKITLTT